MRQLRSTLHVPTSGRGLFEFTRTAAGWISRSGIAEGLATFFCRHTSASLLICENASPEVQRDLLAWLDRAAPEGPFYEHDCERSDDMPAHIRSVLTGAQLSIPIADGRMMLGTWQGLFLAEHRRRPQGREVVAHVIGS